MTYNDNNTIQETVECHTAAVINFDMQNSNANAYQLGIIIH